MTTPSQKRRVVEVSSIRSTKTPQKPPPVDRHAKVLATIEDLPPIPTVEELRQDRDTLLALFHALFFVRGVRHLDSDLTDPDWFPGSAAHLNGASLGGFADCHREVMEEYVPIELGSTRRARRTTTIMRSCWRRWGRCGPRPRTRRAPRKCS